MFWELFSLGGVVFYLWGAWHTLYLLIHGCLFLIDLNEILILPGILQLTIHWSLTLINWMITQSWQSYCIRVFSYWSSYYSGWFCYPYWPCLVLTTLLALWYVPTTLVDYLNWFTTHGLKRSLLWIVMGLDSEFCITRTMVPYGIVVEAMGDNNNIIMGY